MKILSKEKLKLYILSIVVLMLISYVFSSYLNSERKPIEIDNNTVVIFQKNANSNRFLSLLLVPLSSFFLSLFLSFVPYKNFKWSEKYLLFALITMIVILPLSVISLTYNILF